MHEWIRRALIAWWLAVGTVTSAQGAVLAVVVAPSESAQARQTEQSSPTVTASAGREPRGEDATRHCPDTQADCDTGDSDQAPAWPGTWLTGALMALWIVLRRRD